METQTDKMIERYRAARERLRVAHIRGEDTDEFEYEVAAIWSMMSDADRRAVRGVGEAAAPTMKRAA